MNTGPPFYAAATCPKCDHDEVRTAYQADSLGWGCRHHAGSFVTEVGARSEASQDEHFHRHCARCGYEWREEVTP